VQGDGEGIMLVSVDSWQEKASSAEYPIQPY
jgi:hypothetical protein